MQQEYNYHFIHQKVNFCSRLFVGTRSRENLCKRVIAWYTAMIRVRIRRPCTFDYRPRSTQSVTGTTVLFARSPMFQGVPVSPNTCEENLPPKEGCPRLNLYKIQTN